MMRATGPRVVLAALAVCYIGGQAERAVAVHRGGITAGLGVALDCVAVVIVCALVSVGWYLRHGRWVPGHYRAVREPKPRRVVGPLELDGAITEIHSGVWAGPSVAPAEAEDAPVLPMAGELGAINLPADDREEAA